MPEGLDAPPRDVSNRRWFRVDPALVLIVAIGVALRVAWLFQPIRYDEAVTYRHFVREGFVAVVSRYDVPNNHVFHSLLVYFSTLFSGREWAIRLPAFVAGVAVIPLAYRVGRRLHGRRAALFGTALVACAPHLIEYATNGRGYSMVAAFTLLQILLADRIVRAARHADFAAFAVVTALGFYTVPTMLYPTAVTAAWAGIRLIGRPSGAPWRAVVGRGLAYAVLGGGMTAALYAPILLRRGGWANLTANRWVQPLTSVAAWRQAVVHLGGDIVAEWSPAGGTAGFVVLVVVGVAVRRHYFRSSWFAVAVVVSVGLMGAQRVVPFVRVLGFALPMLLLAAGAGASTVAGRIPIASRRSSVIAAAACAVLAAYVGLARLPDRSGAFDKFPQGREIAAFLSPRVGPSGDAVVFGVVPSACIQYYAERAAAPPMIYRAGAPRLWLVTRADQSPTDVLTSNGLRAADFGDPVIAIERDTATVFELVALEGRTPRAIRRQK